ncbi:recombinase family protein [Peribacillus sp. SCS-37]|uniref:recombinase family protein n=1 Tax=Paraperibacillus esterisolvens TaxID=3115296 RepID=UPI003906BABA
MTLAFGYIRRSSYKQQDNNSVEIQKAHILEYARRKGLSVPEEFIIIEDVTSAYSKRASQRKELMRLKGMMVETKIPTVIFYEESRMDRTAYTFVLDFYRPLKVVIPNILVYTTNSEDPFNPDNEQNKIALLLYRQESEIKSSRAVGNLIAHLEAEEKARPGSKVPYGYKQVKKMLTPNEDAEIVTFIYYLHSWGVSMGKIASILNEAEVISPSGKTWRTSTIENILKNPVYTGALIWDIKKSKTGRKYEFQDFHEPLINSSLKQISNINIQLQKSFGRLDTPFFFLNKLTCADCGNKLANQNGSTKRNGISYQYQYYVCRNCDYKLAIDELHEKLLPQTFKHVQSSITAQKMKTISESYLTQFQQSIKNNIAFLENSIDKAYSKGCIAIEQGDKELEEAAALLQLRYQASIDDLASYSKSADELKGALDSDAFFHRFNHLLNASLAITEKRLIILYFVDEILISPEKPPKLIFCENFFEQLLPLDKLQKQRGIQPDKLPKHIQPTGDKK